MKGAKSLMRLLRRKGHLAMSLLACISLTAQAEVYSWTDETGVMYFSDRPRDAVQHTSPQPLSGMPGQAPSRRTGPNQPASGSPVPSPRSPVSVDIDVQNRVEFYPVHGETAFDVAADIARVGPKATAGRGVAGKGIYAFDWRVVPQVSARQCAVERVEVSLRGRQIMPEWVELADAETHWRLWWQSYRDQLENYETYQQELMRLGAEQIAARLKQLQAASDCLSLQRQVAELGEHELGKLRRRSGRLAGATNNGQRLPD